MEVVGVALQPHEEASVRHVCRAERRGTDSYKLKLMKEKLLSLLERHLVFMCNPSSQTETYSNIYYDACLKQSTNDSSLKTIYSSGLIFIHMKMEVVNVNKW